ncbi:MAG TPA: DUF3135 domain-containing protein [Burkholderiales bacterium]|nr:DUF3135 domain-containing protein [Burkholderiales bacterium]
MNFDVDRWLRLAQESPEEFERSRLAAIEETIASAPAHMQNRLRGLQFRIEMERRRSRSALGCALQIQRMMWERFADLRLALKDLLATQEAPPTRREAGASTPIPVARVIEFPKRK